VANGEQFACFLLIISFLCKLPHRRIDYLPLPAARHPITMTSPSSNWKDKPHGRIGRSIPKLLALFALGASPVDAAGRLRVSCRLSFAIDPIRLQSSNRFLFTTLPNPQAIANQVASTFSTPFGAHRALSSNACVPAGVRTIRLESTTGNQIQMFDFKAFTPSGEEVAGGKVATQSSTLRSLPRFVASNAVDGNGLSFSHTDDANPFWEVDLGQDFSISSVEIKNRWCKSPSDPSRCLCRLRAATISLIDVQGNTVKSIGTGDTCDKLHLKYEFGCDDVSEIALRCMSTTCFTSEF
jgi:hypothetical protein